MFLLRRSGRVGSASTALRYPLPVCKLDATRRLRGPLTRSA